jgi:hypothetical protein
MAKTIPLVFRKKSSKEGINLTISPDLIFEIYFLDILLVFVKKGGFIKTLFLRVKFSLNKTYWPSSFWHKVLFVCFVRRIQKLPVELRKTEKKFKKTKFKKKK